MYQNIKLPIAKSQTIICAVAATQNLHGPESSKAESLAEEVPKSSQFYIFLLVEGNKQRKDPKKHTKLNRRAAEGFLDADARQTEGDNNEIEIKLNVPFEIGVKITEDQYQEYGQVLEKILEDILAEDTKETQNWHELKHEDVTN
ncbi:coiled-coil domain-containing protein 151 [Platysternon megacephalum]|uniref:Coiled-coil domain-containing protein 151 n=1 Tax=Platysternon megacephalum TaxID=55544 RepID=A0A4D9E6P1_9SAUR|nr:coiled-coil domain-containing protein 151 [Platysternon megacephalum]